MPHTHTRPHHPRVLHTHTPSDPVSRSPPRSPLARSCTSTLILHKSTSGVRSLASWASLTSSFAVAREAMSCWTWSCVCSSPPRSWTWPPTFGMYPFLVRRASPARARARRASSRPRPRPCAALCCLQGKLTQRHHQRRPRARPRVRAALRGHRCGRGRRRQRDLCGVPNNPTGGMLTHGRR